MSSWSRSTSCKGRAIAPLLSPARSSCHGPSGRPLFVAAVRRPVRCPATRGGLVVDISGRCDRRFGPVKDAFAQNFEDAGDIGASVAVTLGGDLVVDLWGGFQDETATVPWEQDT